MLVIQLAACSDYGIAGKDEEPSQDTAVGHDSAPTDSVTDSVPAPDTAPPGCEDEVWPAIAVVVDDTCHLPATNGTIEAVVKWEKRVWAAWPRSDRIMMTPIVVSVSDDDIPDILVVTYRTTTDEIVVRAVSGADGAELWDYRDDAIDALGYLAAGDIDGDGEVEILASMCSGLVALENDGTPRWRVPIVGAPCTSATPSLVDMDGDGVPEIVIGRAILDADGNQIGQGTLGMANHEGNAGSTSVAVDLDRDGAPEVVVGNATYDIGGRVLASNGEEDGHVAVADFDGDGVAEVVVSARAEVRLQDADGTVLWRSALDGSYGGPPTIADFDGDGAPEIGVATSTWFTVLDGDGSVVWEAPTDDNSSGQTGAAAYDFDEDGAYEVVYADEHRLWILSGADGSVRLEATPHSSGTQIDYAVVADVDNDGHADIVVTNNPYETDDTAGITVFQEKDNLWPTAPVVWNQYSYHDTNVNVDGSIPAVADRNWDTWNDFRAAHGSSPHSLTPLTDLVASVLDVCDLACGTDGLRVWVRIGNQGLAAVDGDITVTLSAETPDGSVPLGSQIVPGLAAGEATAGLEFDVAGADTLEIAGLNVAVTSAAAECDEMNNVGEWDEPVCP